MGSSPNSVMMASHASFLSFTKMEEKFLFFPNPEADLAKKAL